MGLFGKNKCQNCHKCGRSTAGKVLSTVTGANTVGRAAFGVSAGLFMRKCGVCGHYMAEHGKSK